MTCHPGQGVPAQGQAEVIGINRLFCCIIQALFLEFQTVPEQSAPCI